MRNPVLLNLEEGNEMKNTLIATAALLASATSAFAVVAPGGATSVPEISALEGTAALAAIAAVVLLAWERRRRAS